MTSNRTRLLAMASLVAISCPIMAQVSTLDSVTVTATRVERAIEEIPAAVSTVGKDEIQLGNEQLGLDESLARIPGLFLLNRYNFAQDLRASIRGFGARSNFGIRGIKIIVDGIPETLPDGQGSVDGIDLGASERITVIRGPTSSLYGNASGGAILIETERGPKEPFAELRFTDGDYDFNKVQLKAGGDQGSINYLLNLSDTRIDGYRNHSEAENTQASGRVAYTLSDSSRLKFTLHHTDQPIANDPGGLDADAVKEDRTQARDRNLLFDAGEELEQTRLGIVYDGELSEGSDLEARVYHTVRDFSNRLPFEDGGSVMLDRNFSGAGVKFTRTADLASMQNRYLIGIDFDRQDDDRMRFDNLMGLRGDKTFDQNELVTSLGIYLQNEIQLNKDLDLTVGLRYDNIKFDVGDYFLSDGDDSGDVSFNQLSPMIGLGYRQSPDTRIYANISSAFETPTTTEFANPLGGGFNQDLDPQTSINYEVGIKKLTDTYRLEAALFHIDVEDELIPFELDSQPGRSFFENAGSSTRNGVEFSYTRKLSSEIEGTVAYTYSDFKFDEFRTEDGEIFDGNKIPGIPEQLVVLDLTWYSSKGVYASFDAMFSGSFFADNANETEVESYSVSNFRLGYNGFIGDWEYAPFLGINNIFDEEYNNNIRINAFGGRYFEPAPERNFYVGITVRKNFSR